MSEFIRNVRSLIRVKGILKAYIKWIISRAMEKNGPRMQYLDSSKLKLGEWISFSEYWTFQGVVPDREQKLVNTMAAKSFSENNTPVAFDVGANIGAFSLMLASQGFSTHAFEPIPETFFRLKKNLAYNKLLKRTSLNCFALSDFEGIVEFTVDDIAPATNRFLASDMTVTGNNTYKQNVAGMTIDHYCERFGIRSIDFLKIDVEGMEPLVLRGARNLLMRKAVSTVLIEVCPVNLRSAGFDCADLEKEISLSGYKMYKLMDCGAIGNRLNCNDLEEIVLTNIVLLPD